MLEVLKALKRARDYVAGQPPLVKSEPGVLPADENGKVREFWYPPEPALRGLCDAAFKQAGILDIGEDIRSNGVLKVTWCLYLVEGPGAGEVYRLEMEWPVDVSRGMTRPHASVWSLSHCWRHAMMNLLKVRTVDRDGAEPGKTPWTPEEIERAQDKRDLDDLVGEGPAWADMPPKIVTQDAQWQAVGAVVEGPCDVVEQPADLSEEPAFYVYWLSIRERPEVTRRWPGLMAAFKEFSGFEKAQRIEESTEFRQWLQAQLTEAA